MLTSASISTGTLTTIDAADPDPAPVRPAHPVLAVLVAIAFVIGFVFVQAVAFGVVDATWGSIDVDEELGTIGALRLSAIQAAGIAFALALIAVGISSWRGVGLRATRAQAWAGFSALAPVGLVVILPTIGYVLATGDDLVHDAVSVPEAFAYALLALLIAVNEELWFRGLVVDTLGHAARPWLVVIASALLFGLPHYGPGTAALLNMLGVTLAVGIPFAVVRLRQVSLWPLIAWHFVIDIWAFVHTSSVIAEGDPTTSELLAGLLLPAVLAVSYAAWFVRTGRELEREAGPEA